MNERPKEKLTNVVKVQDKDVEGSGANSLRDDHLTSY